jgi:hypothetical protein
VSGTTTIRSASLADAGGILDGLRFAFAPYEQQYTTVALDVLQLSGLLAVT